MDREPEHLFRMRLCQKVIPHRLPAYCRIARTLLLHCYSTARLPASWRGIAILYISSWDCIAPDSSISPGIGKAR